MLWVPRTGFDCIMHLLCECITPFHLKYLEEISKLIKQQWGSLFHIVVLSYAILVLDCENGSEIFQVLLTPTHLAIVMEYAAGGELFGRICSAGRFNEDEVWHDEYRYTSLISLTLKFVLGICINLKDGLKVT